MSPLLAAVRRLCALVVVVLVVLGLTASIALARTDAPAGTRDAHAAGGDAPQAGGQGADAPDASEGDAPTAAGAVVEILPFDGFVDPPVVAQIRDVVEQAEQGDVDLIVLQVDAGGGVSVDVEEVVALIRDADVPVAVKVGPVGTRAEAAGVAGLLWLAADVRAVAADATVGPISPADLADGEVARDAELTAELLADAGLDADLADELLTGAVDADRLLETGAAALAAQGLEPLLVELVDGVTVTTAAGEQRIELAEGDMEVRFHSLGLVRRMLHAATTAPFVYLLLVVGLGMLLFELFQPGFGVAGLAGIVTAAVGVFGLVVLPVVWWGVALVVLGLVLYAVDTAVAGFGPITLAATAAFAVGSLNFYGAEALELPVWLVAGTTLTALVFFVFVMTVVLRAQAGPEGVQVDDLVGRLGTVRSVLNPEGHVYIDGALWRARWTGGSRRAKVGTPVRVHGVDGPVVLVEPFDPERVRAGDADAGGEAARAGGDTAANGA